MDIRWSVQIGGITFDLKFPNHAIITPKDNKYCSFRVSIRYMDQIPEEGGYYVRVGDSEERYSSTLIRK